MDYYDKIKNDDIGTLEYKKNKYSNYKSYLSVCVDKFKSYDSYLTDCKQLLVNFKLNNLSFANSKMNGIESDIESLKKYIENTLIDLVKERITIINQRIEELNAAASAPVDPVVPPPPPLKKGGSHGVTILD